MNGEADVGGRVTDKNANVDERFRDTKESARPEADGSRLRQFFLRTFVPLFLMTFTPNLVILLWYTAVHCDGSFLRLLQVHRLCEKQLLLFLTTILFKHFLNF